MQRLTTRFVFFVLLSFMVSAPVMGHEWTRFHGPNGQGVSSLKSFPAKWGEKDYNWKTKLPGIGHSSPVIWGDKVFLISADPKSATRYVLCISANTGKVIWQKEYVSEAHHLHVRSSFASSTPTVDGDRVYVAWSTPAETTLKALDHNGREVWSLDLGRWQSQHGFGTSPVLYGDMVILSNSQQANKLKPGEKPGESFLMAFDRKTGKERWRLPRVSVNVCYTCPCIYTPAKGKPQLISFNTGNGMFSVDPETGKENWAIDIFDKRTVSSPIIDGNLIFGSTGSGGGGNYVGAIRVGSKPSIAYRVERQAPYVPTSVLRDGMLFLWYDKGFVTCVSSQDGKEHWKKRLDTAFSGSPIRVGDKMFCIDEDGVVFVVAAEKEFKLLAKNPLGEPSRSTPAESGGRMFLRTDSHLICVGAKAL